MIKYFMSHNFDLPWEYFFLSALVLTVINGLPCTFDGDIE